MGLKIMRKTDQTLILSEGVLADRFWTRLRGLIGKKKLNAGEGMLFPRNNSIHLWMMSIPIDVVFLKTVVPSKEWKVIELHSNLKPWKLLPVTCWKASDTLELPSGAIEHFRLKAGEVLCTVS